MAPYTPFADSIGPSGVFENISDLIGKIGVLQIMDG